MDMFLMYLKGLGLLIGLLAYIIGFNVAWRKITGDSFSTDSLGAILGPIIIPIGIIVILLTPFIIMSELF